MSLDLFKLSRDKEGLIMLSLKSEFIVIALFLYFRLACQGRNAYSLPAISRTMTSKRPDPKAYSA